MCLLRNHCYGIDEISASSSSLWRWNASQFSALTMMVSRRLAWPPLSRITRKRCLGEYIIDGEALLIVDSLMFPVSAASWHFWKRKPRRHIASRHLINRCRCRRFAAPSSTPSASWRDGRHSTRDDVMVGLAPEGVRDAATFIKSANLPDVVSPGIVVIWRHDYWGTEIRLVQ